MIYDVRARILVDNGSAFLSVQLYRLLGIYSGTVLEQLVELLRFLRPYTSACGIYFLLSSVVGACATILVYNGRAPRYVQLRSLLCMYSCTVVRV